MMNYELKKLDIKLNKVLQADEGKVDPKNVTPVVNADGSVTISARNCWQAFVYHNETNDIDEEVPKDQSISVCVTENGQCTFTYNNYQLPIEATLTDCTNGFGDPITFTAETRFYKLSICLDGVFDIAFYESPRVSGTFQITNTKPIEQEDKINWDGTFKRT
jgi:hypothetical protein